MIDTRVKNILSELQGGLSEILGDRLERTYLFGSRARGEAKAASDIDVLVVVRGESDYGELIRSTSALVSSLSLKYDTVISRVFLSKERFDTEQSAFLLNVRREAVAI
jgi:predicted nucleotidyltransferase